ncbi:MAG: hypothetical protein QF577_09615 [Phycisphaerae bacterium]|jgi:hypothetical protein|nr:hypothetical protein [Phycisphaerae bacterium]
MFIAGDDSFFVSAAARQPGLGRTGGTTTRFDGNRLVCLTLDIPADWKDRQLYLHFTVDDHAMVWVNGRLVRVRDEDAGQTRWDTPTLAPLKESLKPGEGFELLRPKPTRVQGPGLNPAMAGERPRKRA